MGVQNPLPTMSLGRQVLFFTKILFGPDNLCEHKGDIITDISLLPIGVRKRYLCLY